MPDNEDAGDYAGLPAALTDAKLREIISSHPLSYECPTCHAMAGDPCLGESGNGKTAYHSARGLGEGKS
jgi:hypothetical protein